MANSKVWNVLYRATEDSAWKKLRGRKGFWYADPILFKKGTDTFLFTEAWRNESRGTKEAICIEVRILIFPL